ncbi:MAG: ABC transporter permease [Dehalococcoidia bacterium]
MIAHVTAVGGYLGKQTSWLKTRYPWLGNLVFATLLLAPLLLLLGVFFFYPLAGVAVRSFSEPEAGIENYTRLYSSAVFRDIFRATFAIAAYTTLVCLLLAYPYAYRLSTLPNRWASFLLLLSLVPIWTAILARLYAWTVILGRRGILNDYLIQLGLLNEPAELLFTRTAVMIGMVHIMLPYMIVVLYSTMSTIDRTLLAASDSLGATGFQTFRRVFLPLSMPGVYAGCLLVFIVSLGFFVTPAILGGGGDITIAIYVQREVGVLNWGPASAMSMVLLAVTIVLFFLFNKLFGTERLFSGGIRK